MTLPTSLLATKIRIPPPRANLVPRPRLMARLAEGFKHPLTIISAPAGFGKTTSLSDCLTPQAQHVAWLSLDESDNEQKRFWSYVIVALSNLQSTIGTQALLMLQLTEGVLIEDVLTVLINDIASLPYSALLVLDDYHLIHEQAIHDGMTFLIDNAPPTLRLVLATRVDPPLPLARLRARNSLYELRADDLRFTSEEISKFLTQVMGLDLPSDKKLLLETRTEGWIAGLQLAALSMQGRDAANFIATFSGSHRYVLDYLVDEVLNRQPPEIQSFLLQTSILDRLNASLCDAVTTENDGVTVLKQLESSNLFIVPLDDERKWYRYHPLFADVLRERLTQIQADRIPELDRRAADWYEHHDYMEEAVRHALAAKEFGFATRLIERVSDTLWGRSQILTMLNWMRVMPEQVILSQPRLCILRAWAYAISGQLDDVEPMLRAAEKLLPSVKDAYQVDLSWMSEDTWSFSPQGTLAQIAILRVFVARFHETPVVSVSLGRAALDQIPHDRRSTRGITMVMLGHALILNGEMDAATRMLIEARDATQRMRHGAAYLSATSYLGQLIFVLGQPRQALAYYQQAHRFATEVLKISYSGIELIGMGTILREMNDLESATTYVNEGVRLAEMGGDFTFLRDSYIARARLEQAHKNWETCLEFIQKAEQVAHRSRNVQDGMLLTAWQARMLLAKGDVESAYKWAKQTDVKVDDALSFLREFEHITLARVLVAQGRCHPTANFLADAKRLLDRLKDSAESAGRMGRVIEILIQQALAFQVEGNISRAMSALERALRLAEPEGYVRTFVDEGEPMLTLLRQTFERNILPDYSSKLRAASESYVSLKSPRDAAQVKVLYETISEREKEVLKLIADGKSSQEIAQTLVVALSTVQWHIKNLYAKLDVHSRTQAVKRAKELQLLA